jgi:aldehyde dehydrogenase (NAD+)
MSEHATYDLAIGGRMVPSASGATYETVNPYTGEPWATVPDAGPADVDAAVAAARGALEGDWGALSGFACSDLMRTLADVRPGPASQTATERPSLRRVRKAYEQVCDQLRRASEPD